MAATKTTLLKTAFDRVISVSLVDMHAPLRWINQYFADTVKGFGTAEDEKVATLQEVRKLILNGRKQYKKFSYFKVKKLTPFSPRYSSDNIAVLTDEFSLQARLGDEKIEMHLFFTSVFQYHGNKWKCIAFHGSVPPKDSSTDDTFHVEENKKRILELEQKMEERTAELLQKNKELQIEAAIERVRTVAMAMNKLEDMQEICKAIAVELAELSVHNITLVETIEIDQEKAVFYDYEYYPKSDHKSYSVFNYKNNRELAVFVDTILAHENNFYYSGQMRGAAFTKWIKFLKTVPAHIEPEWLIKKELHFYFQSAGIAALGFVATKALTAFEIALLKRFRNVFHLAYKRFTDIKFAKAQARASEIQLSLEIVRTHTMSLQKSDELEDVMKLIFSEFKKLGLDLFEAGIYLRKESSREFTVFGHNSNGDDFFTKYDFYFIDNHILNQVIWNLDKKKETYSFSLSGKELASYCDIIFSLEQFKDMPHETKKSYYEIEKIYVTHSYFQHGFLEISGISPISKELIDVANKFSQAIDLAYVRFLDLQKAESQAIQAERDLIAIKESKERAENALAELQATQKQLVQSEKMASLGELTAGIAHEIQNPLNFVNNFAEVNTELIDELTKEVESAGNKNANELLEDIKANSEKITFHGKRADAIVKSMLQHSRKSSGQKELTDINALCDEYLRLSYHGLRAKDKGFNAAFELQLDTTIQPISVVSQDIGRVILNLINNAFYAVNERQKKGKDSGYKPQVTITTRQEGNQVVIEVADNGMGMPNKVKEKIFQPFFTTKPTGEGTGLGLSLSYDIVTKGHGGIIEVETKEGEYTNFILRIPT